MSYTRLEMFAYAEGYHDGRADYVPDNYYSNEDCSKLYAEGYANGVEDRNELDERIAK